MTRRLRLPLVLLAAALAASLVLASLGCGGDAEPAPGPSGGADSVASAGAASSPEERARTREAAEAAAGTAPETAAALGLAPAPDASPPPAVPVPAPDPERAKRLLEGDYKTMPSGTRILELAAGSGPKLERGMTASFTYVTYLESGAEIDRSDKVGAPITLPGIGNPDIMAFLNEGLLGLAPGGRRRLVVPPSQAYGPAGRPPVIPPNATLIFEVELVGVDAALPPMVMPDLKKLKLKESASGLRWLDSVEGGGGQVKAGDDVLVNYAGYLEDGTEFDSSARAGRPLPIGGIGSAGVIAGWNEGVVGMRSGGRRILVIPPALGYGDRGFPGAIPPGATLVFVVDVLQVRSR